MNVHRAAQNQLSITQLMTSRIIEPFFEPGAPPLIQPLLTCQTDLSYLPNPPPTIIAREELHDPTRKVQHVACHSSDLPYTKPSTNHLKVAPTPSPMHSDTLSELSDLSDLPSSARSISPADLEEHLIPKPAGEPGRPGRGGYNLKTALGWKADAFSKLQKYVHKLVDDHLDITKCYQRQPENMCKVIRNAAIDEFPQLQRYEVCWPVNDLIMMHLKNTSRREKLKAAKVTEARKNTSRSSKS